MKKDSIIILVEVLGMIILVAIFLVVKTVWEVYREFQWRKSLKKDELIRLDNVLLNCLGSVHLTPGNVAQLENMIRERGYPIQEKFFLPLEEAYTTNLPKRGVYIRSTLSAPRRNFALAHELMHIVYKPEELNQGRQRRFIHILFKRRSKDEQDRDYMAASLLLQKDSFWKELTDVQYFSLPPKGRKLFVYQVAQKYTVKPSTVFRRISELNVIMQ